MAWPFDLKHDPDAELPEFGEPRGGEPSRMLCLGDSHVNVFAKVGVDGLLPGASFSICAVRGATVRGILSPKAKTDAMRLFRARIEEASRRRPLAFLLGEVDCGYLIWYRAEQHGEDKDEQLAVVLERYATFLRGAVDRGFGPPLVLSCPPPSLKRPRQGSTNLRGLIKAPLEERTALTLAYNERLAAMCDLEGFVFVDATTELLDPATGLVAEGSSGSPDDHHLDAGAYSSAVARALERRRSAADRDAGHFTAARF